MSLEALKEIIRRKMQMAAGFTAKVKFDFGDEGILFVDAAQNPPVISEENADADVTLLCTPETFRAIAEGSQDATLAYMTGNLKIKGSMGLAMKLNAILED